MVLCVVSVTDCACAVTVVVEGDWMLVVAGAEPIGALLGVPIGAGAVVGVRAAGAAVLVAPVAGACGEAAGACCVLAGGC